MGMMPAANWYGANGLFPLNAYARKKPSHYFTRIYGGQYRVLPLGCLYAFTDQQGRYDFNSNFKYPPGRETESLRPYYIRNAYLWDLEQAEEVGIDGFGLCLSGNEPSCKHAVNWFKTLEAMLEDNPETHLRLTIAICGDDLPSPEKPEKYAWLLRFMNEFKDSPAWLRHAGRIVLMGYHSHITWSTDEGVDPEYINGAIAVHKSFLHSLDAGDPIFIFDGPEYVPGQITHSPQPAQPELLRPIAATVAEAFDGYSCWGGVIPDEIYPENYRIISEVVNRKGKAWMMPIVNIHSGVGQFYKSKPGVERFLDTWKYADTTNAQLAQIVTWNDSNEATNFQPTISLNYAFSSLTAKFIHRFKHGVFPEAKTDSVYLFYRKYHPNADPYLYPRSTVERDRNAWGETDDRLHVIVFAKAEGTIEVSGTSEGISKRELQGGYNEFKLRTALNEDIAARIYRDDRLVHELISPERVTDRPYREDLIPWGWSSDCRKRYDRDFGPDFRPISYHSQRHNDGIPDWFRLHYFGTTELPQSQSSNSSRHSPSAVTTTRNNRVLADGTGTVPATLNLNTGFQGGLATDDPDGDGVDNLHEYLSGENPLEPMIRLGFVSRRFPDYVPQTTSSISISLPERN